MKNYRGWTLTFENNRYTAIKGQVSISASNRVGIERAVDAFEAMEAAFGKNLTALQLWALTRFSKNVRFRCRNNSAFNNMMGRVFPHATFRQVPKVSAGGKHYEGLQITVNGQTVDETESDE